MSSDSGMRRLNTTRTEAPTLTRYGHATSLRNQWVDDIVENAALTAGPHSVVLAEAAAATCNPVHIGAALVVADKADEALLAEGGGP
jgi:hypothetical protein